MVLLLVTTWELSTVVLNHRKFSFYWWTAIPTSCASSFSATRRLKSGPILGRGRLKALLLSPCCPIHLIRATIGATVNLKSFTDDGLRRAKTGRSTRRENGSFMSGFAAMKCSVRSKRQRMLWPSSSGQEEIGRTRTQDSPLARRLMKSWRQWNLRGRSRSRRLLQTSTN